MSAPAAKTRSPPYTTTARTSSRSLASVAAARISSCTCDVERVHLRPVEPDRADAVGHLEPYELAHRVVLLDAHRHCRGAYRRRTALACSVPSGTNGAGESQHAGTGAPATRRAPVWPGRHQALGATWRPGGDQLRGLRRPRRPPCWVCLFDDDERRDPPPADRAARSASGTARSPASRSASATASAPTGRGTRRRGRRFNPAKLLLDPYARAISGDVDAGPGRCCGYDAGDPTSARRSVDSAPYDAAQRRRRTTTSTGATTRRCDAAGATR